MKILAFTKYGREAASTRQRLLQFLPALEAAGITIEIDHLLGDDYVRALAGGPAAGKASIARAYARRARRLLAKTEADLIWVYADLFPWLPAVAERLAFRSGKPVVYDFDDAFFEPYERNPLLRGKLKPLIAGAAYVTAGNAYLANYARRWNDRASIIPTVVDTDAYRPAARDTAIPVIGWIGSPSTWAYVRPLLPLLRELCASGRARVLAVGVGRAVEADRFDGLELREWSEASEIADVRAMDIGIMPLPDAPWARGKSGYKLVQYMACGLPTVASPVGVNADIVEHGVSGFLATDEGEWRAALDRLLADPNLRRSMGSAGRTRAVSDYSLASQAPRLVEIFREAGALRRG